MIHRRFLQFVTTGAGGILSHGHEMNVSISVLQTDETLILALRISKLSDAEYQHFKLNACLMATALDRHVAYAEGLKPQL